MNRIAVIIAVLLPLCISGCNIVGPIAYFAHGPQKVPALHKLQKSRPTVVFVDDRANLIPRRSLKITIAESAQQALMAHGALNDVIDAGTAIRVASAEKYGEPMTIVDIGKSVGAEVVIYARVDAFSLTRDGQSYSPIATASVKVIDVTTEERLWPPEFEGYQRGLPDMSEARYLPTSAAERVQAEEDLARKLGVAIADMFYETDVLTSSQGRS